MRKIANLFFIFLISLYFVQPVLSADSTCKENITFAWDAPEGNLQDGYKMYMRINNGEYDQPMTFDNFVEIPKDAIKVTKNNFDGGIENELTTYYFVIRAIYGKEESENSNEIYCTVDMIKPLPPVDLSGSYNKDNTSINLKWRQENIEEISYWKIYFSKNPDRKFMHFDTVQNNGNAQQNLIKPVTMVNEGKIENIYFAIVAFKNDSLYSQNSASIPITVDRRIICSPSNFSIVIQVQ